MSEDLPAKVQKVKKKIEQERKELPEDEFIDRKRYEKKPMNRSLKPKKTLEIKLVSAQHLYRYVLELKFDNEETKFVDFHKDIFVHNKNDPKISYFRDKSNFLRFKIFNETGVIKWPNDYAYSSIYLYKMKCIHKSWWCKDAMNSEVMEWASNPKNLKIIYQYLDKENYE